MSSTTTTFVRRFATTVAFAATVSAGAIGGVALAGSGTGTQPLVNNGLVADPQMQTIASTLDQVKRLVG